MRFFEGYCCGTCAREVPAGSPVGECPACAGPLLCVYDMGALRKSIARAAGAVSSAAGGVWRYRHLLPDFAEEITLGEGGTPLIPAVRLGESIGARELYVKDESSNPTGSFKARGLVMGMAKAIELGLRDFVIPTAGNAGGALAAYAARGKVSAHVYMPKDAPAANRLEVKAFGADLVLVDGLISDAGKQAAEAARKNKWFDMSTFKEPYRVEGKKTMGLEVAEQLGWDLPDVIFYPTGGGTGLVGMWKAFQEMEQLGWIGSKRPRMVSVQAEGCAPVVRAVQEGAARTEVWQNAQTVAAGLRVPGPFADRLILRAIHESKGTAIAVSDDEILTAQKELAETEGVLAAPEGAATWAALKRLVKTGWVLPDEGVVLFNTGSGLKYF